MKNKNDRVWLYGIHACKAALRNPERTLFEVAQLNDKSSEKIDLESSLPANKIRIVDRAWFEKKFGAGAVHQGIAIQVSELPDFSLEDLASEEDPHQVVIILDQVSDPHNVGAIIRSAAAFGAKAIVMTEKHAPEETATLAKSASGALELLPIIRSSNLLQAIETLKKIGFWTYGFAETGSTPMQEVNFSGKVALIMGAEGKGMRRLTSENCDFLIHLETNQSFSTLNVSNAAAIALYTVFCNQKKPAL